MCPGSNRRGSGKAAQLITCEIKKSLGFVLACALRGAHGAAWTNGQVGPFTCHHSDGGVKQPLRAGSFQPLGTDLPDYSGI